MANKWLLSRSDSSRNSHSFLLLCSLRYFIRQIFNIPLLKMFRLGCGKFETGFSTSASIFTRTLALFAYHYLVWELLFLEHFPLVSFRQWAGHWIGYVGGCFLICLRPKKVLKETREFIHTCSICGMCAVYQTQCWALEWVKNKTYSLFIICGGLHPS